MQTRRLLAWPTLIAAFLPVACVSTRVYDMEKLQADLSRTIQSTDGIMQKAQVDFGEKKTLADALSWSPNPDYADAESEIRKRLQEMTEAVTRMSKHRQAMAESNGRLAALGYAHKQIHSSLEEYGKVQSTVADFETAAREINSAVVDYSRASNSLADLISQRRLFATLDVQDFQRRVQQSVKTAQANTESMQSELHHAQAVLNNWNKADTRDTFASLFAAMTADAREYTVKGNRLSEIGREMSLLTLGKPKISSTDTEWSGAQKLIVEFDSAIAELQELNERFQSQAKRFRTR